MGVKFTNRCHPSIKGDRDYVIWQNDLGEVFALDNVCLHLQASLSNGWICAAENAIACPFHGLKFDNRGRANCSKSSGKSVVIRVYTHLGRHQFLNTFWFLSQPVGILSGSIKNRRGFE